MSDEDVFDKLFYEMTMDTCPWCGEPRRKHCLDDSCPSRLEEEEDDES
jgi:hypothetical protein